MSEISGITLVEGRAAGDVFALAEPLSFWGGFDALTGNVIDHRHPDKGQCLARRVVVVEAARGSSSGSSVLAEAIRLGTAPAAFVLSSRDAILAVGAEVARELYGRDCPVVMVEEATLAMLKRAERIDVVADGPTCRILHNEQR